MARNARGWRSLRLRITAGALVVVVAALGGAGFVLINVVEGEMVSQIDSTLGANADFIDRSVRSGASGWGTWSRRRSGRRAIGLF